MQSPATLPSPSRPATPRRTRGAAGRRGAPAVRCRRGSLAATDGTCLLVRPLESADREALAAGVTALSPESRYRRFAAPIPALTERALDQLTDLDHHDREALVAYNPITGDGLAVARWAAVPGERDVAEIAVTVLDAWQRRGVGRGLARMLLERARAEGIAELRATALAENRGAIALLERLGFRLRARAGILVDYALPLAISAPATQGV